MVAATATVVDMATVVVTVVVTVDMATGAVRWWRRLSSRRWWCPSTAAVDMAVVTAVAMVVAMAKALVVVMVVGGKHLLITHGHCSELIQY